MSPPSTPQLAPQGPSQLLTALLARLPDATNRTLIDQAAVDFAFLNSKAARKRLVKVRLIICSSMLYALTDTLRLVHESSAEEPNGPVTPLLKVNCDIK